MRIFYQRKLKVTVGSKLSILPRLIGILFIFAVFGGNLLIPLNVKYVLSCHLYMRVAAQLIVKI